MAPEPVAPEPEPEPVAEVIIPPDLDGDGKPGGSLPDGEDPDQAEIDRLRAEIERLGGTYHHKNKVPALQEKLAALKVAD